MQFTARRNSSVVMGQRGSGLGITAEQLNKLQLSATSTPPPTTTTRNITTTKTTTTIGINNSKATPNIPDMLSNAYNNDLFYLSSEDSVYSDSEEEEEDDDDDDDDND